MKETVVVVQVRCGSSRLPNKALISLHGKSMVEWVFERLQRCSKVKDIVFAIPEGPLDEPLGFHLKSLGANVFVGSEQDVLDRFYKASLLSDAQYVVRVCADNPLVSPTCIDQLIDFFAQGKFDYAYNHIPRENLFPDGLGAEIVEKTFLDFLQKTAKKAEEREHIFNHVWNNSDSFKIGTFNPKDKGLHRPELKLDIDTPADLLSFMKKKISPDMTDLEIVKSFSEE